MSNINLTLATDRAKTILEAFANLQAPESQSIGTHLSFILKQPVLMVPFYDSPGTVIVRFHHDFFLPAYDGPLVDHFVPLHTRWHALAAPSHLSSKLYMYRAFLPVAIRAVP